MDIQKKVKALAKSEDYDIVNYLGQWNGWEVYGVDTTDECSVGLPQYILSAGDDVHWASVEQIPKIMSAGLI